MQQTHSSSFTAQHWVVPGQILATMSPQDGPESFFLRGHGTYVDQVALDSRGTLECLRASLVGRVQRVNQLITVVPLAALHSYEAHVGDLVVGRITGVTPSRWTVELQEGNEADLPLSGVHLPGGVQRIRTAQDSREMRSFFQEGDLIAAEVHKAMGRLVLHTRSTKYGKLENGICIKVPALLVPRRPQHVTTLVNGQFQVVWGCNGMIWMQRNVEAETSNFAGPDLVEHLEDMGRKHAETPLTVQERLNLVRLRNAMECLQQVYAPLTQESTEQVYQASIEMNLTPSAMLKPENVVALTASHRKA
jgi:exosome complex component RRP4